MLELAADNLGFGLTPFIEGNYVNFIRNGYVQHIAKPFLKDFLSAKGIEPILKILFCHADKDTIYQRIIQENIVRDNDRTPNQLKEYLDSLIIIPKELSSVDHLKVDCTRNPKENAKLVLKYLQS
ncbi:MAG: hypothetical protein ABIH59_00010 [archaeon]